MPHLTLMQNMWAVLGGLLTGALFTLIGGGGSAIAVPILTTLVGLARVRLAMGTTAVSVACTAGLSAVMHARRGRVVWPVALSLVIPGLVGIAMGSRLQDDLPSHLLLTLLGLVLLFNAGFLVRMPEESGRLGKLLARLPVWARFGPVGLAIGALAGLFGVGGGFLALPSMVLGGLSLNTAIGSSVVSVGSLGVLSAISYSMRGLVDWHVVLEYVSGGMVGSLGMAPLAQRVSGRKRFLTTVMAVVLTGISLYLIAHNLPSLYTPGRVV